LGGLCVPEACNKHRLKAIYSLLEVARLEKEANDALWHVQDYREEQMSRRQEIANWRLSRAQAESQDAIQQIRELASCVKDTILSQLINNYVQL
jgi:hypothetical protein